MDCVFPVLEAQMKDRKVKKTEMAKVLGITEKSLYNKLRGITPWTWDEVCMIRNTYFADKSLEELLERGEGL